MSYEVTKAIMRTASTAAVATTAATVVCGAIENRSPAGALNAISHIFWGETAAHQDDLSGKYTANGVLLNSAAMIPWAALHHLLFKPQTRESHPATALARGAVTAGIAYVVDYHVVPKRLTPGFEKRLSNLSLFGIYAALALALASGDRTRQLSHERAEDQHREQALDDTLEDSFPASDPPPF